jgi:DNA-directed RNA polymerase subunit E"
MAKEKACKKCKTIFEGPRCTKCGSEEFSDAYKGQVVVINPEQSEVAKNLKLHEKGRFAVKL